MTPIASRDRDTEVLEWTHRDGLADPTILALMWLRIGRFEPSHALVQDATCRLAAYTHGMLHRLEGDYWNAKYWFRQVRDPALIVSIQDFLGQKQAPKPWGVRFDPSALVDAVAQANAAVPPEILQIVRWEWEAVWEYALNSLS